jgi:3-oxoadipate enol-lactonase
LLVLAHSLGTDLALWDPQLKALEPGFRVLRYDIRGHGRTGLTPGPYTIAQLGQDVLGLLDALGAERAHFCGLSIGGQIGIWLGARAKRRVDRLALCNTAARIGTREGWDARIEAVRRDGLAGLAPGVLERWFTAAFRARAPESVAAAARMLAATPPDGYAACCAALRDADFHGALAEIEAPTLVIAGRHDSATPPSDGRSLAAGIAGAACVELDAAHISNVEAAGAFNDELVRFLKRDS